MSEPSEPTPTGEQPTREPWLNYKQMAAHLHMTDSQVRRYVKLTHLKFPHVRVNGRRVYSKASWMDCWMAERSRHAVPADAAVTLRTVVTPGAGHAVDLRTLSRVLRIVADTLDRELR